MAPRRLSRLFSFLILVGLVLTISACSDQNELSTRSSINGAGQFYSPNGAVAGSTQTNTLWEQGFEENREGWEDWGHGRLHVEESGYINNGFGTGIDSADGNQHARFIVPITPECQPPFRDEDHCIGPFSRFGGPYPGTSAADGFIVSIDLYLDVEWAQSNPDHRADWSVTLNRPDEEVLEDFVFNIGSSPDQDPAFIVSTSHKFTRAETSPDLPSQAPQRIESSGWYTFRHAFSRQGDQLLAELEILDSQGLPIASWQLGDRLASEIGPLRVGWFAAQDIHHLAMDNALLIGPPSEDVEGPADFEIDVGHLQAASAGADDEIQGQLTFNFPDAEIDFQSTRFDELTINRVENTAYLKGAGELNGQENYGFLLWARAGQDEDSRFRLQLRDPDGALLYDNFLDGDFGTPLSGGQIEFLDPRED